MRNNKLSGDSETASTTTTTGELSARSEEKRKQILNAARELFLAEGFANTSMEAIKAKAGVSKATVYAYFASKEELFTTFLQEGAEELFQQLPTLQRGAAAPAQELCEYLQPLLQFAVTTGCQWIRLVIAEATRYPQNAKLLYEVAIERGLQRVASYLTLLQTEGSYHFPDIRRAAEHLIANTIIFPLMQILLESAPADSPQTQTEQLLPKIQTILHAYESQLTGVLSKSTAVAASDLAPGDSSATESTA